MTILSMSSLTRISDLESEPYEISRLGQDNWATGDYVAAEVSGNTHCTYGIELATGRMVEAMPGDCVIGAFGDRAATLEGVGSWTAIEGDAIDAMTSAGLFGKITSVSQMIGPLLKLRYLGHIVRNGQKVCMSDFAIQAGPGSFNIPTILLVGTSMSAGKTTTGRLIVHELEKMGQTIIGTKLTGAGRYRDVLSFRDAGASAIFDFVDAGLPSTVVPENEFRDAIRPLLRRIDQLGPDYLVAEAGASPLEPYNGAAAIDELGDNICCTVLCASDPYAVVGVEKAFGLQPDLVAGPAAATTAAIDLVRELSGITALNVMDPACPPKMREFLSAKLKL
jgi:hypothetical protein